MVKILQGTTPSLTFKIPFDTSTVSAMRLTISDIYNKVILTKEDPTYTTGGTQSDPEYYATFTLSQTETLNLAVGQINAQLRIKMSTGEIQGTALMPIEVINLADRESI